MTATTMIKVIENGDCENSNDTGNDTGGDDERDHDSDDD